MTDNRTTELREKLAERGIEYMTDDGEHVKSTCWSYMGELMAEFAEFDNGTTRFACDNWCFTPDQAITATLGGGTCEFVSSKGPDYPPVCSACGYDPGIYECAWYEDGTYGYERNYCPNCGAKVVSE